MDRNGVVHRFRFLLHDFPRSAHAAEERRLSAAAVAGLFAVNLDLMIDPVASSNNLWVWLGPSINFLGIPLYNYVGWFIMIFFYDIIIWSTVVGFRRMKGLSIVEAKLFFIRQYVGQVV